MNSRTEDLRVELEYLRDTVVEAALARRSSVVESGLATYEALIATFIDVLKEFGSPYDRDQAYAEIHQIGGGWSEIDWVRDDYREIADAAISSENLSIILPVIYFPIRVSGHAYDQRDYFIYAQFLSWLSYLYTESVRRLAVAGESQVAGQSSRDSLLEIVRDRLASYPYELASHRIGHDLSRSPDPTVISQSCDFAREVFLVFNRLLKSAYDLRRPADFGRFASELQEIYSHHRYDQGPDHIPGEDGLGDPDPAPQPGRVRVSCYRDLALLRRVIYIGLDAWFLMDHLRDQLSTSDAAAFRGSLYLPSGLNDLWNLYLEVRSGNYERELDWTWWEATEHRGQRGAYAGIDFGTLVLRSVVLRMLVTASSMTRDAVMQQHLSPTRDLDYLVGTAGSGLLIDMLNSTAESGRLQALAGFDPAAAVWLRDRFVVLADEQAQEERTRVIEAPLSTNRVERVQRDVLRGWHETGVLRSVIMQRGNYKLVPQAPPADLGVLSIHILERKDLFIDDSPFAADGWGAELGRSLARGEDELVLRQIASAVPSAEAQIDPRSALPYVEGALEALKRLKEPVIVLAGSLAATRALAESPRFEYAWRQTPGSDSSEPSAYFAEVPVYQTYTESEPHVLVTDFRKLGVWRQYIPRREREGELLEGVIHFELEAFDTAGARRFLAEQRTDSSDEDTHGEPSTLERRISEIRERVRILILEQLQFDVTDPTAAQVVRFTE